MQVSKPLKPGRTAVELRPSSIGREPEPRPSRIRRDPPPRLAEKAIKPHPEEREVWVVAIGVVSFALALTIIIIAIGNVIAR